MPDSLRGISNDILDLLVKPTRLSSVQDVSSYTEQQESTDATDFSLLRKSVASVFLCITITVAPTLAEAPDSPQGSRAMWR